MYTGYCTLTVTFYKFLIPVYDRQMAASVVRKFVKRQSVIVCAYDAKKKKRRDTRLSCFSAANKTSNVKKSVKTTNEYYEIYTKVLQTID